MWPPNMMCMLAPGAARGGGRKVACLDGPERQGHGSLATTRTRGLGRARWRYYVVRCAVYPRRYIPTIAD